MTLRVTLEIVPHGQEDKKYKIGEMNVYCQNQVRGDLYEYGANIYPVDGDIPEPIETIDRAISHYRSNGPWQLVIKALEQFENKI